MAAAGLSHPARELRPVVQAGLASCLGLAPVLPRAQVRPRVAALRLLDCQVAAAVLAPVQRRSRHQAVADRLLVVEIGPNKPEAAAAAGHSRPLPGRQRLRPVAPPPAGLPSRLACACSGSGRSSLHQRERGREAVNEAGSSSRWQHLV